MGKSRKEIAFYVCMVLVCLGFTFYAYTQSRPSNTEILTASYNMTTIPGKMREGKLDEALDISLKSKDILSRAYGKGSYQVVAILEGIGKIYFQQGKNSLAVLTLDSALTGYLYLRAPESSANYQIYDNLGAALVAAGEAEKGLSYLRKAIAVIPNNQRLLAAPYWHMGQAFLDLSQLDSSQFFLQKALSIYNEVIQEKKVVAQIYADLGLCNVFKGDYLNAELFLTKADSVQVHFSPKSFKDRATIALNFASIYQKKGDFDQALNYASAALSTLLQNNIKLGIGECYNALGLIWKDKGDPQQALDYFELALLKMQEFEKGKHPVFAALYNNMGACCAALEWYDRAIQYYEKSLNINKHFLSFTGKLIPYYFNTGSAYLDQKDSLKAKENYEEALKIATSIYQSTHPFVSQLKRGLGNYYYIFGDFEKALTIYKDVLNSEDKTSNYITGINNLCIAQCLGKLKQFAQAALTFQKALQGLNYQPGQFKSSTALSVLIEALSKTTWFYQDWYQQSAQLSHLRQARFYALQTIAAIDELVTEFSTESKVPIAKLAHQRYTLATQINLELYAKTDSLHYRQQAFNFAERSKALLLLSSMQEQSALTATNIPPALLQQEYQLRVDLTHLGKKRQEKLAAGHAETDTSVLAYSAKIKNLKDQATLLKAKLEKEYPRYYATKYELKTIDVRNLQSKTLSPNQTLLEYLVGDSSIFIFVIQKQKYGTIEVKKDFPLEQWVRDMTTNGMAKVKKLNPNATANYTEAAFLLYEKLIAPVLKANYLLGQELIIIPDGILGQVPFEALLTSKPGMLGNYANYNYLLKQHQISYGYSATLLAQMIEKKHQKAPTATLLAMAPFASSRTSSLKPNQDSSKVRSAFLPLKDTLSSLQYSGEEIKTIAQRWAGQLFYNREANLNQFVTQADQYRIIHLATHGKADARAGDYSYLAFHHGSIDSLYDKLYARDLYNMSLNADMVVLSACETGVGELQRGEGIVSLARAFTFAGTKSIVTTLWSMNDAKTKELMTFFYAELEKPGMRKDAALRNAKLRYLQQFNTEADPLFWAGFIAIGDMSSLR